MDLLEGSFHTLTLARGRGDGTFGEQQDGLPELVRPTMQGIAVLKLAAR